MTRERAIEILEQLWLLESEHIDSFEDEENKAFEMAISALSDYDKMQEISLDLAFENDELINKSKWIPVSERLPEKNRAVLTYVDTGMTKTYCLADWNNRVKGWEEWIGYRMLETEMGYKVLAWQPLPEPYKAEKPETCKGCLEPCIMYEPDMRACKKKVTERGE